MAPRFALPRNHRTTNPAKSAVAPPPTVNTVQGTRASAEPDSPNVLPARTAKSVSNRQMTIMPTNITASLRMVRWRSGGSMCLEASSWSSFRRPITRWSSTNPTKQSTNMEAVQNRLWPSPKEASTPKNRYHSSWLWSQMAGVWGNMAIGDTIQKALRLRPLACISQ